MEPLVASLKRIVETMEAGDYPLELDSLWAYSVGTDHLTSLRILPVLKGATSTEKGKLMETASYKQYAKAAVDDSDGCMETSDALKALKHEFKTPELAMDAFVEKVRQRARISDDEVAAVTARWRKWLKGVSWSALKGEFVSAHEPANISEKAIGAGDGKLDCLRYSFYHPKHPDYLETLGLDAKAAGAEFVRLFTDQFVCFWSAAPPSGGASEAPPDTLEASVALALKKRAAFHEFDLQRSAKRRKTSGKKAKK